MRCFWMMRRENKNYWISLKYMGIGRTIVMLKLSLICEIAAYQNLIFYVTFIGGFHFFRQPVDKRNYTV